MELGLAGLWVLIGWCGTQWPRPIPWTWALEARLVVPTPGGLPGEEPILYTLIAKAIGVVGGVAGGWLFMQAFGGTEGGISPVYAAATAVGAWIGSVLATDIFALAKARR